MFDKSRTSRPSILQLASSAHAFVVDLLALRKCSELDSVLVEIVGNPNTLVVGFDFRNDLEMLTRHLHHFKFYRQMTLVDLRDLAQTKKGMLWGGLSLLAE